MNIQKTIIQRVSATSLMILTILITNAGCAVVGTPLQDTPTVSKIGDIPPTDSSTQIGEIGQQGDYHLVVELSTPEIVDLCKPVELEFKVTNTSNQAVYLLNWYTPLEGILGDIFQVRYDGRVLSYLGPLVMRAAPLPEQYILLEAGESGSAVVDISEAYDLSRTGHYTIAFKSPRISHAVEDISDFAKSVDELSPVQMPSQAVEVEVVDPGNGGQDCVENLAVLPALPNEKNGADLTLITLTGIVRDVSPSARIIWLQGEVDGFTTIPLTADCMITNASGNPLELQQIQIRMIVRATGQPGDNQALLAFSVRVVPPEEKLE